MTLVARVALAAALALTACGGAAKPAAEAPAKPATKCASVGDQLVGLMSDTARQATEEVDAMRRQIIERCEQDHWSAEAQGCFLHVTTREDAANKCAGMLTAEQGNALLEHQESQKRDAEGAMPSPVAAPPPPAAGAPTTNTSDPCEGGE